MQGNLGVLWFQTNTDQAEVLNIQAFLKEKEN